MNRNTESRFSSATTNIDVPRSRFFIPNSHKTSFNVGELVPVYNFEVYPGDTIKLSTSYLARLQTLITPLMDNVYLDTYFFFVPHRHVWEHWEEFEGENKTGPWKQQVSYTIPQIKSPSGGWNVGTIADHFGLPVGVDIEVSALPFRGYAKIVDEWFRSENLQDPILVSKNDTTMQGVNTNIYQNIQFGGTPFTANKLFDYFTASLPEPLKGPDVKIPLGDSAAVITGDTRVPFADFPKDTSNHAYPLSLYYSDDGAKPSNSRPLYNSVGKFSLDTADTQHVMQTEKDLIPGNLYADLSNATAASISTLRLAFTMQRYYEKLARGGSRYVETLKSLWGVTSPDARLQRTEYLGGSRQALNINQVVQNSETGTTPQGNVSGYSVTAKKHDDFVFSSHEHGYIIGLVVARYSHSYQQGIERHWSRKTPFDFYMPVLSSIGEMAVLNKEIYAQGTAADDEVFGYQEAWSDLRHKKNEITGLMRSAATASLDCWHLGDSYASLPSLSADWLKEDKANVDRALAVTSATSNQIFADFYFENTAVRILPVNSVPGLLDHH